MSKIRTLAGDQRRIYPAVMSEYAQELARNSTPEIMQSSGGGSTRGLPPIPPYAARAGRQIKSASWKRKTQCRRPTRPATKTDIAEKIHDSIMHGASLKKSETKWALARWLRFRREWFLPAPISYAPTHNWRATTTRWPNTGMTNCLKSSGVQKFRRSEMPWPAPHGRA